MVDAEGKTLGRLATQIADVLRGKRKPTYTPHVDVGDFVVVVNAEKIAVTGNKLEDKRYWRHSGYPGGIRSRTLGEHARAPPRGGHPQGRQGDAAPQPARPPAADASSRSTPAPSTPTQAQKPEHAGDRDLMSDERSRTRRARRSEEPHARSSGRGAPEAEDPRPRSPRGRGSRGRGDSRGRGARGRGRSERGRRGSPPPRRPRSRGAPPPRRRPRAEAEPEPAEATRRRRSADVVPGAELDPIALEPERELSAEEKARARGRGRGARPPRGASSTAEAPRRPRRRQAGQALTATPASSRPASASPRSPG